MKLKRKSKRTESELEVGVDPTTSVTTTVNYANDDRIHRDLQPLLTPNSNWNFLNFSSLSMMLELRQLNEH